MTPQAFFNLQDKLFVDLRRLALVKSGEYASDADKLANFRGAGLRLGMLPEQVLLTYLDKHYAAICNYVRDLADNRQRPASEPIQGRVQDMIVYLTLFLALLQERGDVNAALDEDESPRRLRWGPEDAVK